MMDWLFLIEVVLSGLGSGALFALTGIAFVLIYKATKVINLAVGEMIQREVLWGEPHLQLIPHCSKRFVPRDHCHI